LDISSQDVKLLEEIWRVYGKYDAQYLELLSHSEKPWLQARADLDGDAPSNNVIDPSLMSSFYKERLKTSKIK